MRYILLIFDSETMSPEEEEKEFPLWMEYTDKLTKAGVYLGGEALQPTSTATTVKGNKGSDYTISDGPYAELKEVLGGYYLINVPNLDEAIKWAGMMPPVKRGGSIEIRPIMELDV